MSTLTEHGQHAPCALELLTPEWPAPPAVHAAFTLRSGGVSAPPFDSLNLGGQVGDRSDAVSENRRRVCAGLALPAEPAWLDQVHGTDVVDLEELQRLAPGPGISRLPRADAAIARRAGQVCVVQVADCMPVLFAARDGSVAAAAHAGWRGLAAGVLEATVRRVGVEPEALIAWLGPAIGPGAFEVGEEVRAAFLARDGGAASAFVANARGRWQCDLGALVRRRLAALRVGAIYGGAWCTYVEPVRFFSHRRDGQCGRMGAFVWLA